MRNCFVFILALAVNFPVTGYTAEIDGHTLPDSITRFDTEYTLSGCGLRELLFSDLYLLGLYLPESGTDPARIVDSDADRIFLLKVLYKGELPEDLPALWREPLADQVSKEYLAILQDVYDQVDDGDTVEIAYRSDRPEVLRINDQVAVRESDVQLIPALTSLWLGDDPVSGNLKRLLLEGTCR